MPRKIRSERVEVPVDPHKLRRQPNENGFWYESEDAVAAGLWWGREKARLLRWVRRQMGRRLTARERACIQLHFFRGLSYREIGAATQTDASSSYRAVRRGIYKLRAAAEKSRVRKPQ